MSLLILEKYVVCSANVFAVTCSSAPDNGNVNGLPLIGFGIVLCVIYLHEQALVKM